MFWVQFSDYEAKKSERMYFDTLQYAKRFADLYKDEHFYSEIGCGEGIDEIIIETFTGKNARKPN